MISGRDVGFLPPFFEGYSFGVPVANLNGAVIYDIDSERVIRESFMSGLTRELVLCYAKSAGEYEDVIFFPGNEILRFAKEKVDSVTEEHCKNTYKFIVELHSDSSPEQSDAAYRAVKSAVGDKFDVVRSSYRLIEILDKRLTKASAALFLKEYVGADTLVCVGDFENDIDMVKAADIGYAVGNSVDALKLVADRVTADAAEGAIAKIISEL